MAKQHPKISGPGKITLEQLHGLMADPKTEPSTLRQYFELDEERSGPFLPVLKLDTDRVVVPPTPEGRARGDIALSFANDWSRMHRLHRFQARLAAGYDGPIIV